MPAAGGNSNNTLPQTVITKVRMNNKIIRLLPLRSTTLSLSGSGISLGTQKCMIIAGNRKLTRHGMANAKNWVKLRIFCCHTNKVEIPPNGLNVPPALVAITIWTHDNPINSGFFLPTANAIEPINKPTVRPLMTVDNIKAKPPVIQNNFR